MLNALEQKNKSLHSTRLGKTASIRDVEKQMRGSDMTNILLMGERYYSRQIEKRGYRSPKSRFLAAAGFDFVFALIRSAHSGSTTILGFTRH